MPHANNNITVIPRLSRGHHPVKPLLEGDEQKMATFTEGDKKGCRGGGVCVEQDAIPAEVMTAVKGCRGVGV